MYSLMNARAWVEGDATLHGAFVVRALLGGVTHKGGRRLR